MTASNGQRSGLAKTSAGSPRRRKRAEGRTGSVSSGDGRSRATAMHAPDPDGDVWSEHFEQGRSPGDGQAPPRELLPASANADATAVQIVADATCDGELSTPLDWRASRTATLNRDRNGWGALTSRGHLARWMGWSLATGGVVLGLFTVAVVTGGSHAMNPRPLASVSNVTASRADVTNPLPKVAAAALRARTSATRRGMHARHPRAASARQDSSRRRTSVASAAPVAAPPSSLVARSDARRQGSPVPGSASGRARQTPLARSAPAAVSSPTAVSRPASTAPVRAPQARALEESGPMQFFRP
jgi:hypothetical protein